MTILPLVIFIVLSEVLDPACCFEIPFQCRRQKCSECVFEARCHYDLPLFNTSAECKKTDCEKPEKDHCPPLWENDKGERGVCYHRNTSHPQGFSFADAKKFCEKIGGILPQFEDNFILRRFLSTKQYQSANSSFYIGLMSGKDRFSWLSSRFTLLTDLALTKIFGTVLKSNLTRITPAKPENDCVQVDRARRQASLVPCQTKLSNVMCMLTIDHCRVIKNASIRGYPLYRPPNICSNNGECLGSEECTQYHRLGLLYCCPKTGGGYVVSGVDPRIKSDSKEKEGEFVIRRLVRPPNTAAGGSVRRPTPIITSSSAASRRLGIQKFLSQRA